MRKLILISNLAWAAVAVFLTGLGLVVSHGGHGLQAFAISVAWIICAVRLYRAHLWPWAGSLLAVSFVALELGAETLRYFGLIWQADFGDRTIEVDPTTIGMPLLFSGLLTIGALCLLAALISLPVWPLRLRKVRQMASACLPPS